MKSALLKQTLADYKSKLYSTIGTFMVLAALYLIIIIPCIVCTGVSYGGYQGKFFSYVQNYTNSYVNIIILPTILVSMAFYIIHFIRNNYINSLAMSSSRNSYLISDIAIGVTHSSMFAILGLIADTITRLIISNASAHYVYKIDYGTNISMILQNAFTSLFLCIAMFFIVSSIINCIARKKWGMIIVNLVISIAFFILMLLPGAMYNNASDKMIAFLDGYIDFISSWYGMSMIAIVYSAIIEATNYLYIQKGGFRR